GPPIVQADTPLGRAILKKSIDRLEATLFINPDRGDAAYALGFCYSFHIDGIWNADRADELLRRAAGSDPDGPLGAAALRLLGEISFNHDSGQIPNGHQQRAVEQMVYVLQRMPSQHRDVIWARLPATMSPILSNLRDTTKTMQVIEFAAAEAERDESPFRYQLAMGVNQLSVGLIARGGPATGPDPIPLLKRWATGEQVTLKQMAARALAQIAVNQREYAEAATWYLTGVASLAESDAPSDRYARDNLRVLAARCLRQAGRWREALDLLESFQPQGPTSLNVGYYAVELGQCYIEAKDRDKALDVLVTAAERVRSLRDNSPVEQLINQLGGVPLSEDRDVDVSYFAGPDGKPLVSRALATDGSTLFCAGGFLDGVPRGVLALNTQNQTWRSLTKDFGRVTSMAVQAGQLWVGTEDEGVWRCSLTSNDWTQWSSRAGLPDDRVTVVAANKSGVVAGLGTPSSGGVVHIDSDGRVTVLDGQLAPTAAPTSLIVQGDRLLAATQSAVHEFDLTSDKWISTVEASGLHALSIFPGQSHAWASRYGREIAPYGADDEAAQRFRAAWFTDEGSKAGYKLLFVVEHKDQTWFGGDPWARFRSVGLYRIDPRTGDFRMYGLRDGFRMSTTYTTYAAAAIGNDLWLATSAGLARV
ncbi:MAG: CDC27 family protein, partial [Planctomycetota bacterium]